MLTASKPMELLLQILLLYRNAGFSTVVLAGFFVVNRLSGRVFGLFDGLLLFVVVMPLIAAVVSTFGANIEFLITYHGVRRQWERVSALLPRYERTMSRAFGRPRGRLAAAKWRALMLAHTVSPEAGLAELLPLGDDPEIPHPEWLRTLGAFHGELLQLGDARETFRVLVEHEPDNAINWATIVECDGIFFDDAASARRALHAARACPNFGSLGPLTEYVDGIMLCVEGAYEDAIERLGPFREWTTQSFQRFPGALSLYAGASTMLAVAYDGLGRTDEAVGVLSGMRKLLAEQQVAYLLEHAADALALRGLDHLLPVPGIDRQPKPA